MAAASVSDPETSAEAPVCSVVIPAYNSAATVGAAIQSALSQRQSDLEVIVIDDGSTDGTARIAGLIRDPRVRVRSQSNRGLPAARNAGIRAARGRCVAFLDSDDLWLPDYLQLATSALDACPDAGFAYTDAYTFEPITGRVYRHTTMHPTRPPIPPPDDAAGFLLELLARNFVYVSTVVRRSVLEALGGFNESRTAVEDYELWLRILVAGHRAVWIPGQHALYRAHRGQMSSRLTKMYQNLADVFADLRPEEMPSAAHRDLLASRRAEVDRQLRALRSARLRGITRRTSHSLGRIRLRYGRGESWYDVPPAEVSAAFPDLRAV